jgi:serine O-acetyltransferase
LLTRLGGLRKAAQYTLNSGTRRNLSKPAARVAASGASLAFRFAPPNTPRVNLSVTQLTDQLLASYARVGGINHLDGKNLPSKTAITGITLDLLRLLFPGFFDEKAIQISELKVETATLMDSVLGRIEEEIRKSLVYAPAGTVARDEKDDYARVVTLEFLAHLPRVRELLQTDAEAAFNGDPAALSKDEVVVAYPFIEAIAVQRLAHELYSRSVPLIPRIMTEWAHSRTGMDIHPGAQIGSHFFVDHCTGTVIGETCVIGRHVKLYHGVTLGARSTSGGQQLKGKKRHPTIEDRVTIYPGATILGGETVIGEGSTIGGNVFIMDSVAPNSLVIYDGLDMRVLSKSEKAGPKLDFQI